MHATAKMANLEKIRQRFGENSKIFKENRSKSSNFNKLHVQKGPLVSSDMDENGDLTKNRHKGLTERVITCPKRSLEKWPY